MTGQPEATSEGERLVRCEYPILEHDPARRAMIEPDEVIEPADVPEHCVLCFFGREVRDLVELRGARVAAMHASEWGEHPLYELDWGGRRLALMQPGVGAPTAAALLEEVIARGCKKFVVCGGCGVLDRNISVGHVLLPTAAVRDEGTSYHYLPPAREVEADPQALAALEALLAERGVRYLPVKTWTTDAFYRETRDLVALRRAEGCVAVEMEAAALFAVARYRGVPLAQLLYAGDNLDGEAWDGREWHRHEVRLALIGLAADACLRM